jgi:hypothetical protein
VCVKFSNLIMGGDAGGQAAALGAIFSGSMAAFAPLVGTNLGAKKVSIRYAIAGKSRSAEIPGILHMAVAPLPTMHPSGEIWTALGHPVASDRLALAVGAQNTRSPTTACVGTIPARTAITLPSN